MATFARKRFGQHFLRDENILWAIVDAIDPRAGDRVVEIGPGQGALTRPLLTRLPHLDAVELDRDLVARLRDEFPPDQLTLHSADALAFDFAALGKDLRVVGNLPYNISTPLLFHLADAAHALRDCHFMLQKEVVDRMVAAPATGDYGRLSVMLQYRFHMEALLAVPPESFDPPPRVDSTVVRLIPRSAGDLAVCRADDLSRVVTLAFSQRRKMLRSTLKPLLDETALRDLGIDPARRAETLGLEEFIRLANATGVAAGSP